MPDTPKPSTSPDDQCNCGNKPWDPVHPFLHRYDCPVWGGECRGCEKPLLKKNMNIADGCPCNAPRGVNHGHVPEETCTCPECDPRQTGSSRYVTKPSVPGKVADQIPNRCECEDLGQLPCARNCPTVLARIDRELAAKEPSAPPVVETSLADEAFDAWIESEPMALFCSRKQTFLAGRASAKAEQAPGQPSDGDTERLWGTVRAGMAWPPKQETVDAFNELSRRLGVKP